MFLALNEILKEKARFILILAVITLVSYLVFFLIALAYGLATSYTKSVDQWGASSVVLSKNSNNNIGRSLLFNTNYSELVGENVAPLGVGAATVNASPSDDVSLFGINTNSFLNPAVSEGSGIESAKEVVVSDELKKNGVTLNSDLILEGSDSTYRVVGFVKNATFQTAPVIYMTMETWRTAASEVSGMTAMRDNSTISALIVRNNETPKLGETLEQKSIHDFIFALPGYQAQVLTFSLMIGFLIGIAAFVLAIFIYILTMQKKNIFGVLKAEGVPSSYIGWSVMMQVALLSIVGLLIGMALAVLTGTLFSGKVPFAINPLFYIGISAIFVVCAIIGGIASVRSVTKIDPVEAIG